MDSPSDSWGAAGVAVGALLTFLSGIGAALKMKTKPKDVKSNTTEAEDGKKMIQLAEQLASQNDRLLIQEIKMENVSAQLLAFRKESYERDDAIFKSLKQVGEGVARLEGKIS